MVNFPDDFIGLGEDDGPLPPDEEADALCNNFGVATAYEMVLSELAKAEAADDSANAQHRRAVATYFQVPQKRLETVA